MALQVLSAQGRPHGRLAAQLSAFPGVSALHRLKSCSPSVSVSIVDFTIAKTDWTNDNERDSLENLEVW